MKELYISPELSVMCFAPVERLADNGFVDFDDIVQNDGVTPEVQSEEGDFDFDFVF